LPVALRNKTNQKLESKKGEFIASIHSNVVDVPNPSCGKLFSSAVNKSMLATANTTFFNFHLKYLWLQTVWCVGYKHKMFKEKGIPSKRFVTNGINM